MLFSLLNEVIGLLLLVKANSIRQLGNEVRDPISIEELERKLNETNYPSVVCQVHSRFVSDDSESKVIRKELHDDIKYFIYDNTMHALDNIDHQPFELTLQDKTADHSMLLQCSKESSYCLKLQVNKKRIACSQTPPLQRRENSLFLKERTVLVEHSINNGDELYIVGEASRLSNGQLVMKMSDNPFIPFSISKIPNSNAYKGVEEATFYYQSFGVFFCFCGVLCAYFDDIMDIMRRKWILKWSGDALKVYHRSIREDNFTSYQYKLKIDEEIVHLPDALTFLVASGIQLPLISPSLIEQINTKEFIITYVSPHTPKSHFRRSIIRIISLIGLGFALSSVIETNKYITSV